MNAHRRFLRTVCFPIFLNKPDDSAGGGGGQADAPKTLPEATAALTKVRGELATALQEKESAESAKLAAEKERDQAKSNTAAVQGQFEAATKSANEAKAELGTAKEQITALTKERDEAKSAGATKDQRIKNLEALCGVQGVDPNAAVPVDDGATAKAGLLEKFMKASASDKAAMIRKDGAALYAEAKARGINLG